MNETPFQTKVSRLIQAVKQNNDPEMLDFASKVIEQGNPDVCQGVMISPSYMASHVPPGDNPEDDFQSFCRYSLSWAWYFTREAVDFDEELEDTFAASCDDAPVTIPVAMLKRYAQSPLFIASGRGTHKDDSSPIIAFSDIHKARVPVDIQGVLVGGFIHEGRLSLLFSTVVHFEKAIAGHTDRIIKPVEVDVGPLSGTASVDDIIYGWASAVHAMAEEDPRRSPILMIWPYMLITKLIYAASETPEAKEWQQSAPPLKFKKTKLKGLKLCAPEKPHCMIFGKAFGEYFRREREKGRSHAGSDGRRTVRPHIRRGHWHRFRTGKRDAEVRPIKIMWLAPIFVHSYKLQEDDECKSKD